VCTCLHALMSTAEPFDRYSRVLVLTLPQQTRGYHVVSVTDPYGRILDFLDRSLYFIFQVASQL
jgi:hypothetical protein